MRIQNAVTKLVSRAVICGLLTVLAACGSNKEPEAYEQARRGFFPLLNALACLTGAENNISGKPGLSGTTGYSPNPGQDIAQQFDEYEPNSSLNNANPVSLTSDGLAIAGTITNDSDVTVNMDAGLAYYVAVSGYNLNLSTSSYQLAIVPITPVHSPN